MHIPFTVKRKEDPSPTPYVIVLAINANGDLLLPPSGHFPLEWREPTTVEFGGVQLDIPWSAKFYQPPGH